MASARRKISFVGKRLIAIIIFSIVVIAFVDVFRLTSDIAEREIFPDQASPVFLKQNGSPELLEDFPVPSISSPEDLEDFPVLSISSLEDLADIPVTQIGPSEVLVDFPLTKISPPGILVDLSIEIGIGNQLLRYASSLALAKKFSIPLYMYDNDNYGHKTRRNKRLLSRKLMLDFFHLPAGIWVTRKSWNSQDIHSYICEDIFHDKITNKIVQTKLLKSTTSSDYLCHSEKSFQNVTQEIKQLRPVLNTESHAFVYWKKFISQANSEGNITSVAVHIERGDYLQRQYWTTPMSYFRAAMRLILQKFNKKKILFFIFSDDTHYVRKRLLKVREGEEKLEVSNGNIYLVSGTPRAPKKLEESILMSMCKNMIISNSAFSWWAANLMEKSKESVIIAPKYNPRILFEAFKSKKNVSEFKTPMLRFQYPSHWINLDPYSEI